MVWSTKNATNAYLKTLETVTNNPNEPDVASFISALAAGSGAKLIVEACSGPAGPTTLALVAATCQTGGRVVCILPGYGDLQASFGVLGLENNNVNFVVGDAAELLAGEYMGADFVVIDRRMDGHNRVGNAARDGAMRNRGGFVLEYNLFCHEKSRDEACDLVGGVSAELLPIGGGMRICKVPPGAKRSRWVVCTDEATGEEHVVRIVPHSGTRNKF